MKKTTLIGSACFSALLLASPITAHAIVLENSDATPAVGSTATILSFDPSGGNFLAVLVSGESSATLSDGSVSVTFGGTEMSNTAGGWDVFITQANQFASIYYLFDPGNTAQDITVDLGATTAGMGVSVLSLSGVDSIYHRDGYGRTASPITLTPNGVAGGWMLAAGVDNTYGPGADGNYPTWTGDQTYAYSLQLDNTIGGLDNDKGAIAHAYAPVATTQDDFNAIFTKADGTGSSRQAAAVFSLAPIPEPTAFALLLSGLGALIVSRFRRA